MPSVESETEVAYVEPHQLVLGPTAYEHFGDNYFFKVNTLGDGFAFG